MSVTLFPKKITVRNMGLTTHELESVAEAHQPKAVSVVRVWGIISDRKSEMSSFGGFTRFTGEIAALNLVSGEESRSQSLILPQVAETVVNSLFDKMAKDVKAALNIALEVTVAYNNSQKGGTRFSYGVKPLFEFKSDDALSQMAKQLPSPVMVSAEKKAGKSR